jgi:hypothetical protein
VVDAGRVARREFEERCGQIARVDRASEVVCEEDAFAGAGGQFVDAAFVLGLSVADDQRGSGHDGVRMEQKHRFRGGLRRSVRGDGVGLAVFVVGNVALAGEDGVGGDLDHSASGLRRGDREADGSLGCDCPVGPAARCIDDDARVHLGHDRFHATWIPQVEAAPSNPRSAAGPGRIGRGRWAPRRYSLPDQLGTQEPGPTHDQQRHEATP